MKAAIVHSVAQGSQEWLALRARHYTASEAPAMMGCSPYQTRNELLRQKAHGAVQEVSPAQQRVFDAGHAAEAAFLPHAETLLGCELYPVTVTREVEEGLPLLASMDGLSMDGLVGYEHKVANASTLDHVRATGTPPDHHVWQLEHQMLVTDAESILFVCSDGTDGAQSAHCHYRSHPERRAALVAGWLQFQRDLANPDQIAPAAPAAPAGRAPESLPALRIEVTGMVTASNLDAFKTHALAVFQGINRDLATDQHFADAEATVKWCASVEDRLAAAKQHALSQTESIDALFRAIDDVSAEARRVRLELDKLVKARKDQVRVEIAEAALQRYLGRVRELNVELMGVATIAVPPALRSQIGESMKGRRTIDTLRDAAETLLTDDGAEAQALADRYRVNHAAMGTEHRHLFPDFQAAGAKPPEDFAALLALRQHQAAEAARVKAQREAVEAQARAERERQRLADIESAAIRREAVAAAAEDARKAAQPAPTPILAPATTPAAYEFLDEKGEHRGISSDYVRLLSERLGITITADALEALGFPAHRDRSARLYPESDWGRICDALIAHIARQRQAHALGARQEAA